MLWITVQIFQAFEASLDIPFISKHMRFRPGKSMTTFFRIIGRIRRKQNKYFDAFFKIRFNEKRCPGDFVVYMLYPHPKMQFFSNGYYTPIFTTFPYSIWPLKFCMFSGQSRRFLVWNNLHIIKF